MVTSKQPGSRISGAALRAAPRPGHGNSQRLLLDLAIAAEIRGIGQYSVRPGPGRIRHARLLDVIASENVKYGLAGANQIICNDPSMASPPHGLRAHDCGLRPMPQLAQPGQTDLK